MARRTWRLSHYADQVLCLQAYLHVASAAALLDRRPMLAEAQGTSGPLFGNFLSLIGKSLATKPDLCANSRVRDRREAKAQETDQPLKRGCVNSISARALSVPA
jgi:hypothetical protein